MGPLRRGESVKDVRVVLMLALAVVSALFAALSLLRLDAGGAGAMEYAVLALVAGGLASLVGQRAAVVPPAHVEFTFPASRMCECERRSLEPGAPSGWATCATSSKASVAGEVRVVPVVEEHPNRPP